MSKQANLELLRTLFKKYKLTKNEIYEHKGKNKSGPTQFVLITAPGIKKIQVAEKIQFTFNVIHADARNCTILAEGEWKDENGNIHDYKTLASCNDKTTYLGYYAELAEKRGRSRVVLELLGLYDQGVLGSEELTREEKPEVKNSNDGKAPELTQALKDQIDKTMTFTELAAIHNGNPKLHTNKAFINALGSRRIAVKKLKDQTEVEEELLLKKQKLEREDEQDKLDELKKKREQLENMTEEEKAKQIEEIREQVINEEIEKAKDELNNEKV